MPINVGLLAPQAPSPTILDQLGQIQGMQINDQNLQLQKEQAQLRREQAAAARDEKIRDAADDAAIRAGLEAASDPQTGELDGGKLLGSLAGKVSQKAYTGLQKVLADQQKQAQDRHLGEIDLTLKKAGLVPKLFDEMRKDATTYAAFRPALVAIDPQFDKLPKDYDPEATPAMFDAMTERSKSVAQQAAEHADASKRLVEASKAPAEMVRNLAGFFGTLPSDTPIGGKEIAQARAYGNFPDEVLAPFVGMTPQQVRERQMALTPQEQSTNARADKALEASTLRAGVDDQRQADALAETKRHNRVLEQNQAAGAGGAGGDDAKAIAKAIADGDQPPSLTSLYRMAGPVRAELARMGYALTRATEDWNATTKYLATLNGAQQIRLRQAVNFTQESLPVVENLVREWDGGGFKVLNKAQLALAAQGALGQKAQSIATRLQAQIADITSELGTVYKGGNSSTDESLKLAAENIKGDWSKQTLLDAIGQIRQNLSIRSNSIKTTGVIGSRENNPYAPAGTTGDAPKFFYKLPDGSIASFNSQGELDAFKKRIGG